MNGLEYYPNFLDRIEAINLFSILLKDVDWKQNNINIYDKYVKEPRLTCWYGDKPYTYSGLELHPIKFTKPILFIKNKIEKQENLIFNSCLCNLYRNGKDSIGYHKDDEPELGNNPIIASVSLGETRELRFKDYKGNIVKSIILKHGSLLIISDSAVKDYKHGIEKDESKGKRINLTFRNII